MTPYKAKRTIVRHYDRLCEALQLKRKPSVILWDIAPMVNGVTGDMLYPVGEWKPLEWEIQIDPRQARDTAQMLFALAHEFRHAWQWENGVLAGDRTEREEDANAFALRYSVAAYNKNPRFAEAIG